MRRRDLAFLFATPLLAQTPAPRLTPDQELEAARQHLRENLAKLAKQPVAMATEPAFAFKVY